MTRWPACWSLLISLIGSVPVVGDDTPVVDVVTGGREDLGSLAFELRGLDDEPVEVRAESKVPYTVVCFLGAECPMVRLYAPRLAGLADEFADEGVRFVGVGSNHQDSPADLEGLVRECGITFPVARDHGNEIADRYGATRTPEVYVLDRSLTVRYRGRIDDEFAPGVSRSRASRQDLRQALRELVAREEVSVAATPAVGCLIGRVPKPRKSTELTYTGDIAPILRRHCVECHRVGEIGPFALTDYDEVVGWGPMIAEVVEEGRMPPWHANPEHGRFVNARSMPDGERSRLREWVEGGMPFGEADRPTEPLGEVDGTWHFGREPDVVVPMRDRPFRVPADTTVEYQYYVVDPGFTEDRWVVGAQVVPGNRAVVHHCIVFIRPPDWTGTRGVGWLTAYVPGQRALPYPEGHARRVPAGSRFVFQMHYTPNGRPQEDLTRVGLLFGDEEEITHEVFTMMAVDHDFEIPPHTANHEVRASLGRLPSRGELLAIAPHMHVRGRSFTAFAERGSRSRILLDVPNYDFGWQHVYAFEEPVPLADVDRLSFRARFDNSGDNPSNPDPSRYVTWGDQTSEEMAIAFFEIAVPREAGDRRAGEPADVEPPIPAPNSNPVDEASARFAVAYLERFDRNGDGRVLPEELPSSVRRFGFDRLDLDGDGAVTRAEVERSHQRRVRR